VAQPRPNAQDPPDGVSGKLIYAGNGDLRAFTRLEVSNSIVMVDFNCGASWFNAPLLGRGRPVHRT